MHPVMLGEAERLTAARCDGEVTAEDAAAAGAGDDEPVARPRAVALPVAYGLPWLALRMVLNAVSARFPAALPCL
jgi:hypothetical protein